MTMQTDGTRQELSKEDSAGRLSNQDMKSVGLSQEDEQSRSK